MRQSEIRDIYTGVTVLLIQSTLPGMSVTLGGGGEPRLHVAPGSHVLGLLLNPHYVRRRESRQFSVHQIIRERRDLWRDFIWHDCEIFVEDGKSVVFSLEDYTYHAICKNVWSLCSLTISQILQPQFLTYTLKHAYVYT